MTIYCKVVAKEKDYEYTSIVVQDLESQQYICMTIWPNWQGYIPDLKDVGYITYKEVIAGIDTWFDGTKFVPYNYTNIVFIKFIKEKEIDNSNKDLVI